MIYANSLKNYAYQHIKMKFPETVHKGELEKMADEWGFEHENIGRRCRELWRSGLIERVLVKSKKGVWCAAYRWLPPTPKSPEEQEKESQLRLLEATR